MQPPPADSIYQFGDFELDARKRTLVLRATGQPVEITGRVMEALVYLVERAGQLAEKKALMEALWPHVVVEEGNLTQTIHSLRRVLGEKAGEHRYIATVPGRGYRFVAEVRARESQPAAAAPPARQPARSLAWSVIAIVSLLTVVLSLAFFSWRDRGDPPAAEVSVAAEQPSIAVLPFVDMSESQDQVHFAEGLSEEILNLLARADTLRVIARTSSFSFKDENADIGTIARRLSVTHVLEGSVRKSGERVRITAQLIDGATSAHVWSDTFDRDLGDIFGVQREIAAAVADALQVTIGPDAPSRAETRKPEAYEHYLQGRHLFNRRSGSDLLQAKSHFQKAVQIDPDYGRAWAALAGLYLVSRFEEMALPDVMPAWKEAVERAVATAPDLAETHYRAAQYYWQIGDEKTAQTHIDRAFALDPNDPLLVGKAIADAMDAGRFDDAIDMQKKRLALDPLSSINRGNLGSLLAMAGRLPEAEAEMVRALELSPASAASMAGIADVLILQSRLDEAAGVIARMPEGYLRDQRLAMVHFARGEASEGEAILARVVALAEQHAADLELPIAVAEVYAARNDADSAFAWLQTALHRARAEPGILARHFLRDAMRFTPLLKSLHADPRWTAYLAAIQSR